MLAQGQSSPAKRGRLAADVSSGLIFLKKKKGKEKRNSSWRSLGLERLMEGWRELGRAPGHPGQEQDW